MPLSEVVNAVRNDRDRPVYHKDLLPVVYVVADQGGARRQSALRHVRRPRRGGWEGAGEGGRLGEYFIRQPSDPYREYAIKWDGEWQVTYETFRDMGIAYAVGLVLIYLLVVAQFRSYLAPLDIMAQSPLACGVSPAAKMARISRERGMIALAGTSSGTRSCWWTLRT